MPSMGDLQRIAEVEFGDIVRDTITTGHKLRIFLFNNGRFNDDATRDMNQSEWIRALEEGAVEWSAYALKIMYV